jgi:hypothetical protein
MKIGDYHMRSGVENDAYQFRQLPGDCLYPAVESEEPVCQNLQKAQKFSGEGR